MYFEPTTSKKLKYKEGSRSKVGGREKRGSTAACRTLLLIASDI